MSGSRVFRSGVGTQMTAASARSKSANSVLGRSFSRSSKGRSSASGTSWTCERPARIAEILLASVSIPATVNPPLANSQASGRPTYPSPITATVAVRPLNFSVSRSPRSGAAAAGLLPACGPDRPRSGARLRGRAALGRRFLPLVLATLVLLATAALLGALLPVMPDEPLADVALLNPTDHILQALIDLRVVHDPAEGTLPSVDLAHDRIDVADGTIDLLEQIISVAVVVHQPSDQPLAILDVLRRAAQRRGHRPEIVEGLGALSARRRQGSDHP